MADHRQVTSGAPRAAAPTARRCPCGACDRGLRGCRLRAAATRRASDTRVHRPHWQEGAGSIFYSIAPDDVHNPTGIRHSFPYQGHEAGSFPCEPSAAFESALRGQTSAERETGADAERQMGEATLQVRRAVVARAWAAAWSLVAA